MLNVFMEVTIIIFPHLRMFNICYHLDDIVCGQSSQTKKWQHCSGRSSVQLQFCFCATKRYLEQQIHSIFIYQRYKINSCNIYGNIVALHVTGFFCFVLSLEWSNYWEWKLFKECWGVKLFVSSACEAWCKVMTRKLMIVLSFFSINLLVVYH